MAANNLAWRYAEDGGNLDVALSLAQTAKRKLPDSPEVSDTLGWIYLKKDLDTQAVDGVPGQRAGQSQGARLSVPPGHGAGQDRQQGARRPRRFDAALKLKPDYKEAAAARRALADGDCYGTWLTQCSLPRSHADTLLPNRNGTTASRRAGM